MLRHAHFRRDREQSPQEVKEGLAELLVYDIDTARLALAAVDEILIPREMDGVSFLGEAILPLLQERKVDHLLIDDDPDSGFCTLVVRA